MSKPDAVSAVDLLLPTTMASSSGHGSPHPPAMEEDVSTLKATASNVFDDMSQRFARPRFNSLKAREAPLGAQWEDWKSGNNNRGVGTVDVSDDYKVIIYLLETGRVDPVELGSYYLLEEYLEETEEVVENNLKITAGMNTMSVNRRRLLKLVHQGRGFSKEASDINKLLVHDLEEVQGLQDAIKKVNGRYIPLPGIFLTPPALKQSV